MTDPIYIPLLDEGVHVWRPAPAWRIAREMFIILRPDDCDPADEHGQFPPGSTGVVEQRWIGDGIVLAALRAVNVGAPMG